MCQGPVVVTTRTPEGDAVTDLVLEIFRANGRLLAAGDALVRPRGQTAARWQVLGAIRTGPNTVAGIARIMGLSRQSVQRTTDVLGAEGLVEYVDNPAHRRAKLVQLSERGRAFLLDLAPAQGAWANALAGATGFDESRIRSAHEVVLGIRTVLEEAQRKGTTLGMKPPREKRSGSEAAATGRRRRGSA
jgi:DNA-binding MarR family transcriptional regulator